GPAPRGVPLIPIRARDDGLLEGRARIEAVPLSSSIATQDAGPVDALAWYRYCGHQDAPGLRHDWTADSLLRFFVPTGARPWYADREGAPIRVADLAEPGAAAAFQWRSVGETGTSVLTGAVVRVAPGAPREPARLVPPAKRWKPGDAEVLAASFLADGLLAASTFCTHFCCLPAYRDATLACPCHNSVFSFEEVAVYSFPPERAVT
ncbi:MAG TPA: hypothetical protein VI997_09995, partial [Candidatus Thermoplasmatota archaeon]|nr:hypothetical protein [Candidatus Thermoplasmatota archaeon]